MFVIGADRKSATLGHNGANGAGADKWVYPTWANRWRLKPLLDAESADARYEPDHGCGADEIAAARRP
jgi:hypothetical protein